MHKSKSAYEVFGSIEIVKKQRKLSIDNTMDENNNNCSINKSESKSTNNNNKYSLLTNNKHYIVNKKMENDHLYSNDEDEEEYDGFYEDTGLEICLKNEDFMDNSKHNHQHHVNTSRSGEASTSKYEVLSSDKIFQSMIEIIKDVNQILELPPTTTRILLHHFRWDKEKLIERFYDADQDRLFKEAHIVNPFDQKKVTQIDCSESKQSIDCGICYIPNTEQNMICLKCDHKSCKICWKEYLKTKILDEAHKISCAAHDCDMLLDDDTVMSVIDDTLIKRKYHQLITNSFVECNRLMRWCPAPDCTNAIKVEYNEAQHVKCDCGHTFCFGCGELWHDPIKCYWLKKWNKKRTLYETEISLKNMKDELKTINWIVVNTKECPKCHVTIQKNGGCNHMICKNKSCSWEFCWRCLGPSKLHVCLNNKCNSFDSYDEEKSSIAKNESEKDSDADMPPDEFKRFVDYYNRYMNHYESLQTEQKLTESVHEKMKEMEKHNISWIDLQFLPNAIDSLFQCRQTLMYTYAFAFFLKRNNHSYIFEYNQSDLEKAVRNLSIYLKREITFDNAIKTKQNAQEMYNYCQKRRKVLLDQVHEGYEQYYWKYLED